MTISLRDYHDRFVAPLTPVLVEMSETGVRLNRDFVRSESHKLEGLRAAISAAHERRHGRPLLGMSQGETVSWLFGELGLVPRRFKNLNPAQLRRGAGRGDPSLSTDHLNLLAEIYADHPRVVSSLTLIRRYRQAIYLLAGLGAVADHVDHRDGRVHTLLRDTLATGRISSTEPNLQGIAKRKVIAGVPVSSRNLLVASEGCELISFDIKEADIRAEANAVASFPRSAVKHLKMLRDERMSQLGPHIGLHLDQLKAHRNPAYRFVGGTSEPSFLPSLPCALGRTAARQRGTLTSRWHVSSRLRIKSERWGEKPPKWSP